MWAHPQGFPSVLMVLPTLDAPNRIEEGRRLSPEEKAQPVGPPAHCAEALGAVHRRAVKWRVVRQDRKKGDW